MDFSYSSFWLLSFVFFLLASVFYLLSSVSELPLTGRLLPARIFISAHTEWVAVQVPSAALRSNGL